MRATVNEEPEVAPRAKRQDRALASPQKIGAATGGAPRRTSDS